MSVRLVGLTHRDLAYYIYADRTMITQEGSPERPVRGLYFVQDGESSRALRENLLYYADDVVAIMPKPVAGCDTTLVEPEEWVAEIADSRGMRPAKNLYKLMLRLSDEEFCDFVKKSCILRRWYREAFVKKEKVYTLFESLVSSKKDFIARYWEIRKHMAAPELLSSILTFLARIEMYEDQREGLTDFYRKIVRKGKGQGMNLPQAIHSLVMGSRHLPLDMRMVLFCFQLRGS